MNKKRALIICPGRGTYNKTELGYFQRFHHSDAARCLLQTADELRSSWSLPTVSELDSQKTFKASTHLKGQNAAALIYSAALCDMQTLPLESIDPVAVLGNSMGFYISLVASGALNFEDGLNLVTTMGQMPKCGGQVIYPIIDENWLLDPTKISRVHTSLDTVNAKGKDYHISISIHLGGFMVLAGTDKGCKSLLETLPAQALGKNRYPFQLAMHSAFHSPLMQSASENGNAQLHDLHWHNPKIPLIDGRGHVWRPKIADPQKLNQYTVEHQVTNTFDFTRSVQIGLREFAPELLILLGPGETLGAAVAHVLIQEKWQGISSKATFLARQKEAPFLFNMARPEHKQLLESL